MLAGGEGTRLDPLTRRCPKPLLSFGGRRLIDYTLLNCQRSDIPDPLVLTQYGAEALERHLERTWRPRLPAMEWLGAHDIGRPFRGTADAVRCALRGAAPDRDRVLVLASDHVYRMDYRVLLDRQARTGADAVLSAFPCPRRESGRLGVLHCDDDGRVDAFAEKPGRPARITGRRELCLASMGIYLFRRPVLERLLDAHPDAVDFGHHVLPRMLDSGARVTAYEFGRREPWRWWRDIGDLDTLYASLMDLLHGPVELADEFLYELDYAPPARPHHHETDEAPGIGIDSWIGAGAVVNGLAITRSVLGAHARVDHHAEIRESVLLDRAVVGAGARLRRVVVEEGAVVPPGAVIGYDRAHDAKRYPITAGGLVLVPARDPAETVADSARPAELGSV